MKKKAFLLLALLASSMLSALNATPRGVPFPIEVGFIKTVHITFPSAVKYVDLGSNYLVAGKADETENVIRVKAAYKGFEEETNFSVICEDGSFYTFAATYADNPCALFFEMNPATASLAEGKPDNRREVLLEDIAGESPLVLRMILSSVYKSNRRDIARVGERRHRIEASLKGIYVRGNILYFHLAIDNGSNVTYDIDYVKFTVRDRKKFRKEAIEEETIYPVREFNDRSMPRVQGKRTYRTVYAFNRFTLAGDKLLEVEIAEKRGGRTLRFTVQAGDILRAGEVRSILL